MYVTDPPLSDVGTICVGEVGGSSDLAVLSGPGLRIILGCGLGMAAGTGVFLIYTIGVFVGAIAEATGWDRAQITSAALPASLSVGLLAPLTGWLTDRFGPRRILLVSSVCQGIGMMLIGFAASAPMAFIALFVMAGVLGCAQTPVPFSHLLVGWFNRQRGIAIGIAFTFAGLGIAVAPPLAAMLIEAVGWRHAYVLLGILAMLVTFPSSWLLLRDWPRSPRQSATGERGLFFKQAARQPLFWIFFLAFFLNGIASTAGSIMLPAILADAGIPLTQAALALSVVGVAMMVCRLGFGYLLDHLQPVIVTAVIFAAPCIGYLLLAFGGFGLPTVIAAACCFGCAAGAEGDAPSFLLVRAFGRAHFAKIFGTHFLGFALGMGLGPAMITTLRYRQGSYEPALFLLAGGSLIASLLLVSVSRRHLPY